MIILDFETNSSNEKDVIELAAVKLIVENGEYKIIDKFHRYYLSRWDVNPYSYAVHKLSPEKILKHRNNATYASYYQEDEDFVNFCKNPKLDETCLFYGIDFDPDSYHSATYDVSKTYEILKKMKIII